MIKKIETVLDTIRPYLNMDGGDIIFVKYEDGCVYVKLTGACHGCLYSEDTIHGYIEETLKAEIPEILEVVNVDL